MPNLDRKYFGFLYWRLGKPKIKRNARCSVMTRYIFGVTSNPFITCKSFRRTTMANKQLSTHEKKVCTKYVYVDDCILATDDQIQTKDLLLKRALKPRFNLRKLYNNTV